MTYDKTYRKTYQVSNNKTLPVKSNTVADWAKSGARPQKVAPALTVVCQTADGRISKKPLQHAGKILSQVIGDRYNQKQIFDNRLIPFADRDIHISRSALLIRHQDIK